MGHKKVYVWEFPVILTHLVNLVSILALSVTGLYIGAPFIHSVTEDAMTMAWMRHIHFLFGYLLLASFIIRMYWMFAGNKYAQWREFVPLTGKQWADIIDQIKFYAFIKSEAPHVVGHASIAALTYLGVFALIALEIVTGFAMYHLGTQGVITSVAGGWLLGMAGLNAIRAVHHVIMWFCLLFFIIHFYISIHNDLIEKTGLIKSIFVGYKTFPDDSH